MKACITLLVAILISTSLAAQSFYASAPSQQTKQLASIWKNYKKTARTLDQNDITMVYGGADVSRKLPIAPITVIG